MSGGRYTGSDSEEIKKELARLRADAAQGVVRELETHNERIADLEEWRITCRIGVERAESRHSDHERRLADLEAFKRRYIEVDNVAIERFKERIVTYGGVLTIVWPIVSAIIVAALARYIK